MHPATTPEFLSFFHQLADSTEQIVFIYQPDFKKFNYINPVFDQIWQLKREDVKARPTMLVEAIHPEDRSYVLERFKAFTTEKATQELEFRITQPDQSFCWICLTAHYLGGGDTETLWAGFAQNITKQKDYNSKMKELHSRKNSVLEILSHDLAGPMNTIKGLSDILAKKTQNVEDKSIHTIIGHIQSVCQRGVRLIRDFVNQEFLESASEELIKQRINLSEKVGDVIRQYQESEKVLSKTFLLETNPSEIYVQLDEFKFMQVINNLLSNAIKFTQADGLITIRLEQKSESVLLTISDNGIGIPAHLQAGLFEKFTKARRPGIQGEPSTGLGMSIIKTIVEWHSGKIWFKSKENEGTTYYIELPQTAP